MFRFLRSDRRWAFPQTAGFQHETIRMSLLGFGPRPQRLHKICRQMCHPHYDDDDNLAPRRQISNFPMNLLAFVIACPLSFLLCFCLRNLPRVLSKRCLTAFVNPSEYRLCKKLITLTWAVVNSLSFSIYLELDKGTLNFMVP